MGLSRKILHSISHDSQDTTMGYELYDLDRDPRPVNESFVRGIRFALLVFLLIVMVGAISIFGIGIWTLEAEYGNKQVSELISAELYKVDSYLLIIGGACIIIITLIGVAGVLKEYRCLLGLHLGLLAFMSVMLFVAGILSYILVGELEYKVRDKMEEAVVTHYGYDITQNGDNKEITEAWDKVQQSFECCGVYGGEDSVNSWHIYKRSKWFTENQNNGSYVPASCCKDDVNLDLCTGYLYPNASAGHPPRQSPPISDNPSTRGYTLFTRGCFDVLDPYLQKTGIVIGTTALFVGIVMLIELVLSICLYRTLPEKM